MATTRLCPKCNLSNLNGALTCERCGFLLSNSMATRTMDVDVKERSKVTDTIVFTESTTLLMYVEGHNDPLHLDFRTRHVLTVGRSIPEQGVDVDLNPFNAKEMGVSRQHAMISRLEGKLYVTDLDSGNGTYINGVRIPVKEPQVIHDVDELRFGRLATKVYWA